MKRVRYQSGATLIEVLITIIVLAIGLLGLAGLQVTSIQANQSAYYRSQANLFAYDLADRMRANRVEALGGGYAVDFPVSTSNHTGTGSQAEKDKADWLNNLARTLPNGTAKVEKSGTLFTIHVRWNDTRGEIRQGAVVEESVQTFLYRTEI